MHRTKCPYLCLSIHTVPCYSSHLVHRLGDYVPDWHMFGFTSIGLLFPWLKTWLLISRQLYLGINGQTIRLTQRDKRIKSGDRQRLRKDMNDLDCNGSKCCFSWKHDAKTLNSACSPSLIRSHRQNPHMFQNHAKKNIYQHNFAIKTFIIVQNCTACALYSHDNKDTCSVPIISCPCIQIYLNERYLDPLCSGIFTQLSAAESCTKMGHCCPTCFYCITTILRT